MMRLGDIVRRHAVVRGGKTAYVVGTDRVTYADFHERSNRLAHALARLGVARGTRLAIMAPNRVEYPIVYFAVLKLGAIVVPVNARFTAAEVAAVRSSTPRPTCSSSRPNSRRSSAISGRRAGSPPCATCCPWTSSRRSRPRRRRTTSRPRSTRRDPHVMLYTSGTTGSPKGTLVSHRTYWLQATTSHLQLGFSEDDVGLSMFPMFHMGGWSLPLGFWHTGATVVIMPKAEPRAILETIARERVTYLYAVPTVYASLLAVPDLDAFDLGSLRLLGGGTAPMTAAQVHAIRTRLGCERMVILYGSTEAGPVSVLRPPDVARKAETVGRPYLDVDVRLVDEDGRPVARGEVGEITVRSEFTMLGYWRNPEETARTVRDGWVHTGDLGVFDDEGVPRRRRPPEGSHPERRREHLPGRDRARAPGARGDPRGRRRGRAGLALGRSGRRGDRPMRRRDAHAGGRRGTCADAARGLQEAAPRGVPAGAPSHGRVAAGA